MINDIECMETSLSICDDNMIFGPYDRGNGKFVRIVVWRDEPDAEGNREIYPAIHSVDKDDIAMGVPPEEFRQYATIAYRCAEIAKEMWGMES